MSSRYPNYRTAKGARWEGDTGKGVVNNKGFVDEVEERYNDKGRSRFSGGNREGLVVSTAELGPLIVEWIRRYELERPMGDSGWTPGGGGKKQEDTFMGPVGYLTEWSGLTARSIWDITHQRTKFTTHSKAEALVLAMDMPQALAPGGPLTVVPNPRWSQEHWVKWMRERGCDADID